MELLELGAVELIEMGRGRAQAMMPVAPSPVVQLFRLVDYVEDPYRGVELDPGESIEPRQAAIARRLKTLSTLARKGLVREHGLGDFSYSSLMSETMRVRAILDQVGMELAELGKLKLRKKFKKIAKKVVKVVKSPAVLSVVGLAANLIPGAGQAASAALLGAAGIRAKQEAAKAAARGQDVDPLNLVVGQVAPALAMSQAAAALGIGEKEGAQSLADSFPKPVRDAAEKLVPGFTSQIQAVGMDNFLATALKAIGQISAIDSLVQGAGLSLPGGLSDLLKGAKDGKAFDAGKQDLKNLGAAVGDEAMVNEAMERGTPSAFPVVPVVIGGTAAALGLALLIAFA